MPSVRKGVSRALLYLTLATSLAALGWAYVVYPKLPLPSPQVPTIVQQAGKRDVYAVYYSSAGFDDDEARAFALDLGYARERLEPLLPDHQAFVLVPAPGSPAPDPVPLLKSLGQVVGVEDTVILFAVCHPNEGLERFLAGWYGRCPATTIVFYNACHSGALVDRMVRARPRRTAVVASAPSDAKEPFACAGLEMLLPSYSRCLVDALVRHGGHLQAAFEDTHERRARSIYTWFLDDLPDRFSVFGRIYRRGVERLPGASSRRGKGRQYIYPDDGNRRLIQGRGRGAGGWHHGG